MTARDWSDLSGFPTDPTPAEVLDNVRQLAEAVAANCRALPTLATVPGTHALHASNAIMGRCIYERSRLLRGGEGAKEL